MNTKIIKTEEGWEVYVATDDAPLHICTTEEEAKEMVTDIEGLIESYNNQKND